MSAPGKARRRLSYVDPANHTPQFSWRNAGKSGRQVFCENVPLAEIARRYETPTYVYSRRAISDAFRELDRGLGGIPHLLCFAVKANGNLSVLKLLAGLGSGFDIVSGGELAHLGHLGIPGKNIVFSGVGKTREEIREALRYRGSRSNDTGILQFNVESPAEMEILIEESSRRASGRGHAPGVSIRVNPDVKAGGHPHIATGLQHHKFGVAWPEARKLYLAHRNNKTIRWQGISAHIGSQIVELTPFRRALQRLAGYLLDLRRQGIDLKILDVGGGLGARYTSERPAPRAAYAKMIAEVVRPLGVQLLLEPGRSIIAESCVLLSRVIYTKQNSGKSFVIIDAAMNDLLRPVLYDAPHPITRVALDGVRKANAAKRADIVGPVCETGDTFLFDWPLGNVSQGDLVAIWVTGAYGFAQSSNYNGRGRSAEILVDGNNAKLIRRRETRNDLLRTDVLG
ncbi:MAG TPA: diaminopimelate decarboxylase [Candidatus Limnocylindrales bacterium]|nr:diaminopimelate decarboxylase [Candidatus Limnocylindrales bacterium]